ncbi:hypothetical protein WKK05_35065 [Nostoc sp. UHCC 0302]
MINIAGNKVLVPFLEQPPEEWPRCDRQSSATDWKLLDGLGGNWSSQ